MKLSDFLNNNDIDAASFAENLGVTREAVRLWLLGERTPRAAQMRKIISFTNGSVMPNDFLTTATGECKPRPSGRGVVTAEKEIAE